MIDKEEAIHFERGGAEGEQGEQGEAARPAERARLTAIGQALLVTFLWSTSWVLIKVGLDDLPPLTFAGLRYTLAALLLVPFALGGGHRRAGLRQLSAHGWRRLLILGIVYYTVNQGALFLALLWLPAVTLSLLLNFSAVLVALLGIAFLGESLSRRQWSGIVLFLAGVLLYFGRAGLSGGLLGLLAALAVVASTSWAAILGRSINRDGILHPMTITAISMGLGAPVLLVAGLLLEPWPALGVRSWLIIGWLAVVNTAFAFSLWNQTLRTLTAVESSLINNTMLIQIAILAWLFLGEALTGREIAGLAVAAVGIVMVQLRTRKQP